jgi:DNA-binding GntR family transcriptional regulator
MRVEAAAKTPSGSVDQPVSLQEQAYLHLKHMIETGRIKPGERLLEAQLVKAFGISRSPARRALQSLCSEGVIVEHGKRGYQVAGASDRSSSCSMAELDPIRISQPRQWELMYSEVEQDLYAQVLFGSVRIHDLRLANHFGVSRTVTRDLLAQMHGMGLISKDDMGHWVAERVTPQRILHLYQMRLLLEPQTLLDAAPHLPKAMLERARANVLEALSHDPIDSAQFDQVETDLHLEILSCSPNAEILYALRRTHLIFGPTRHLIDPILGIPMTMIVAALREHLSIIDHLLTGDADAAASALHAHLADAIERWMKRFEIAGRIGKIKYPSYLTPVE